MLALPVLVDLPSNVLNASVDLQKIGTSYATLRKECLTALKQWPGCETVSGIQIIRDTKSGFSVRITLYGTANQRLSDRAVRAVEREMRRRYELTE